MIQIIQIIVISTLFNHLGLADKLVFWTSKNIIINCTKCLSFWLTLIYSIFVLKYDILLCGFVSFLSSYVALWFELLLNVLNNLYNRAYGKVYTAETDAIETGTTDKMP